MGLPVFILRPSSGYDGTNGGVSSKVTEGILTGPEVEGPFDPKDYPTLVEFVLVIRRIAGIGKYYHVVPREIMGRMTSFGGNYITTSDSRFPNRYPIPIHDRVE